MLTNFINAGIFFVASTVLFLVAIFIFGLMTRYKIWHEINNGNLAVAYATGGIILGISNVMRFAITSNDQLLESLIWGGLGTVILLLVYAVFELVTPKLNVSEEIAKGNRAVGFISLIFSVGFSFIIGASIT
jgi:putative membrane protein